MSGACDKENRINEVALEYRPSGARVVFLVETTSDEDIAQVRQLFAELPEQYDVISLCTGKLMGFCIQHTEPAEQMLQEIEESLRANYPVVVVQSSFDEQVWQLVSDLSGDTASRVSDVPNCDICGKVEPFPTVTATLLNALGDAIVTRHYCESCAAGNAVTSNKEFLRSLLKSDTMQLTGLEKWELTRRSTQKKPMRFKVACADCKNGCAGVD